VRGGKTPEIDLRVAQQMGYRLAIVPGLLLKAVIGACDEVLAELKATHVHPVPRTDMTVREAFNRVGAAEWDVLRTRFRDEVVRRAGEPVQRRFLLAARCDYGQPTFHADLSLGDGKISANNHQPRRG